MSQSQEIFRLVTWLILASIVPSFPMILVLWIIFEAWPLLIKVYCLKKQPKNQMENDEKLEWFNNCLKHFWIYSLVPLVQHWKNIDLGAKSPRLQGVRVAVATNAVILDLNVDAQLEPKIVGFQRLALQGTVRLIFKKLVPNDLRLFGEMQIQLIHPWTVDYEFQGIWGIFNFFKPIVNWTLLLILCQNYSYSVKNPYPLGSSSVLAQDDYMMRWKTSKMNKMVVIQIVPIGPERSIKNCSCFTCLTPLAFLSKGNQRSKIRLTSTPMEIILPLKGYSEEITIESLKLSLSKNCHLKSKHDFSLALNLNKRYQGEVKINGSLAQVSTEIHPLRTSILVVKIIEVQCCNQDQKLKIEPLVILQLTGQDHHIQHTQFGLESTTWTFDEEFAFLIGNDFTDKLILELVDCRDQRGKIKQDDLNAVEVFVASMANEDDSKILGRTVLRIIDLDADNKDKYMELSIGSSHTLKVVLNLYNPRDQE